MNIRQKFHGIRYFITDAWDEWRHSPGVNLMAAGTLTATLFLAGLVMLVIFNVESRVRLLHEEIRVEIYLVDEVSQAAVDGLRDELSAVEGVSKVEYIDEVEALRRYRQWASGMAQLVEDLEVNPLPATLEVFLRPGPEVERLGQEIAVQFRERTGVEDIRFDRDWLRRLEALLGLARIGGTGLAFLVFVAVAFVMASVLRLAVYARRNEIEIMLLVGATPAFVRGPFLVAGLGQGVLASSVALLLVEVVRRAALAYSGSGTVALLDLLAASPLSLNLSLLLLLVGLTVSSVGAYFAVLRSL
jgi:cell division transport system permease protein